MLIRAAALVLLVLVFCSTVATFAWAKGSVIGARIDTLAEWLKGQQISHRSIAGFARGVGSAAEDGRLYTEDNGVVALAYASYHDTRNSYNFDEQLETAVRFLLAARTTKGDFYQYYDSLSGWKKSGRLYAWNSYAVVALAYSAYLMATLIPAERPYWLSVGRAAESTITSWRSISQDPSGAWAFYSENGTRLLRIDSNGALLAGLSYLALLERLYGDNATASKLATYAQSVAKWLVNQHEWNSTSWGFGGLYTDLSRSTQELQANTVALFGLNSYYKIIGLLTSNPSPSVELVRSMMVAWMDHYVSSMVDSTWGPFGSRTLNSVIAYPKFVSSAGWLMRAAADIWINIGTLDYQLQTGQVYEWLTGRNELGIDLQLARNRVGEAGGFLLGINDGSIVNMTTTTANAAVMFGMVHGSLISIPEFDEFSVTVSLIVLMVLAPVFALCRRGTRSYSANAVRS